MEQNKNILVVLLFCRSLPHDVFVPVLAQLRAQIARIEGDGEQASGILPFGLPHLDQRPPGGSLALGCLHEVAGGGNGAVDGAAAACFAAGIAARLSGPVLWCIIAADLFAPKLAQAGLHPDRVIHVEGGRAVGVCLHGGRAAAWGLAAVVGEASRLPKQTSALV